MFIIVFICLFVTLIKITYLLTSVLTFLLKLDQFVVSVIDRQAQLGNSYLIITFNNIIVIINDKTSLTKVKLERHVTRISADTIQRLR